MGCQPITETLVVLAAYLMPSLLHDTALVTAIGGRACTCRQSMPVLDISMNEHMLPLVDRQWTESRRLW